MAELEDAFGSETAVQNLILDLTDVRLVDQEAVRFLADCEARGVELRNYPAYIREWIDAEKASQESTFNQHETNVRNRRAARSAPASCFTCFDNGVCRFS